MQIGGGGEERIYSAQNLQNFNIFIIHIATNLYKLRCKVKF